MPKHLKKKMMGIDSEASSSAQESAAVEPSQADLKLKRIQLSNGKISEMSEGVDTSPRQIQLRKFGVYGMDGDIGQTVAQMENLRNLN